MRNEFYFQIEVSNEQLEYATKLVEHSIQHHSVSDIFQNDPDGKKRQREFRLTGTLGEVMFADAYELKRPHRSFGAVDGQDDGQDFLLEIDGKTYSFDIKSMGRKNNIFKENYVLNLPSYQMQKSSSLTDYYYCISLHQFNERYIASFIGFVSKKEIQLGKTGVLYQSGTKRIKDDGKFFTFQRDTYEVDFKDISTPLLTPRIKNLAGFQLKKILAPFKK